MRIVAGLGNPGRRYRETPHNVGFRVCDLLVERHGLGPRARKFQGELWRGRVGAQEVAVLKPETYMNLSGESVAEALRYLPAGPQDLLVVIDDMDLPVGRLRLRARGGDGGHLGLRSVIERLGTSDFARLRVGVGRPPEGFLPARYLLSRAERERRERLGAAVERGADAVEAWISRGIEAAMNEYNPPLPDEQAEEKPDQT
jgi:PTH1 family peptidyl-tRNA hydrolase